MKTAYVSALLSNKTSFSWQCHREKFHTNYMPVLTTCHCYWLPTRNECAKWGEVRSPVPCFSSGKPFNLTSFFKSSAETFILLLSWENQGRACKGSLSISLYFKSLFIIISHHLLLPCFRSSGSLPPSLRLAPSLALWTSSCLLLLSHQSPPLTSSFLLICKSLHPQIPSSTTDTPSSYHSVSFLPSAELLLDFFFWVKPSI